MQLSTSRVGGDATQGNAEDVMVTASEQLGEAARADKLDAEVLF